MKKLLVLLASLVALPTAAQLKIGVINAMTGPEAPIGENLTNGIKLAEADLAKKGVAVELVWEDDRGRPQSGMTALEKLATRDDVVGVVGPYTSHSAIAVSRLAEEYKVPLLVPVAAAEEITREGYEYVFRLSAPANQYASVLLDAVSSLGKPQTIAYLYENTEFGTSTTRTAKRYAEKLGIRMVADEPYSKGSPDHRSLLVKVKDARPDLVFMASYFADAILLMRQAREIGLEPAAFLGGGAGFSTLQFANEEVSDHVFSATQWTDDVSWPGAKEFGKRYEEEFGRKPTYHAACAYQAMMVMADAAAKANGKREKLREALAQGTWTGIMGEVDFTDYDGFTNQNRHQMLVQQVQGGHYETVFPPQFSTAKAKYPFPGWK